MGLRAPPTGAVLRREASTFYVKRGMALTGSVSVVRKNPSWRAPNRLAWQAVVSLPLVMPGVGRSVEER